MKKTLFVFALLFAATSIACASSPPADAQTHRGDSLSIVTENLPKATVGSSYSATLVATGGTSPYSWVVTPEKGERMAPGLTLAKTGAISGTPTTTGTFTFLGEVTDSSARHAQQARTFYITVSGGTTPPVNPPTPPTPPVTPPPTTGSPAASLSTTSITFGTVSVGTQSATQSVSLSNTGTSVLTISNITITGSAASDFQETNACGGTLAAGGSCIIDLTFTPSVTGTESVILTISDNAVGSPQTVSLSGVGQPAQSPSPGTLEASCGTLGTANATYSLSEDVSSAGTCFTVSADGVTLNLNGHTITYNTGSNSTATYAVNGQAHNGFTMFGGSILEGTGTAATYAHTVSFSCATGTVNKGPTIYNVNFTWHSESAAGINVDYCGSSVPGNAAIYNNTFNDQVVEIVSRYDIDGASIRLDNATAITGTPSIYNNTIIGGPQGGILSEAPTSNIYGNTIKQGNPDGVLQSATGVNTPCPPPAGCQYTNDFSIYDWANHQSVHNNTIAPTEGRGISVDAVVASTAGSVVANNNITVIEHANNPEYGGCQTGGAYGIQYDDAGNGSVTTNTVEADALDCQAIGMRVTASGAGATSSGNKFLGKFLSGHAGPKYNDEAIGLAMDGAGGGYTSQGDTFTGDSASVYVDWDGITAPVVLLQPILARGPSNLALTANEANTPGYRTFAFVNGGTSMCASCLIVVDPVFQNGAAATSYDFSVPVQDGTNANLSIRWTYSGTVKGATSLGAVDNGTITVTNAQGQKICSTVTSANGSFSCAYPSALVQFDVSNGTVTNHNPYTVTVTAPGCTEATESFSITGTSGASFSLAGC